MQNDDTHATYGYSWMCHAVEEQAVADCSKIGTRDKLNTYLRAKLEETVDVVGWWGVSIPFLSWNLMLI